MWCRKAAMSNFYWEAMYRSVHRLSKSCDRDNDFCGYRSSQRHHTVAHGACKNNGSEQLAKVREVPTPLAGSWLTQYDCSIRTYL